MKSKLAILIAYALVLIAPVALNAQSVVQLQECKTYACNDPANHVIELDSKGQRGKVCFPHKTHETFINPDKEFAHQAQKGAECIGCHHRRSEATGVPTLWKCGSCHRVEGNLAPEKPLVPNPKNTESDEMWNERAYHGLCINCHKAANAAAQQNPPGEGASKCKAPVACSECHESKPGS